MLKLFIGEEHPTCYLGNSMTQGMILRRLVTPYLSACLIFNTNHCPKLRVIVLLYQMITIDNSSEPDATAALLKLKQKEQVFAQ